MRAAAAPRVAFATAAPGAIALGDPTGLHVQMSPAGLRHLHGSTQESLPTIPWDGVRGISFTARAVAFRRPAVATIAISALASLADLEWAPQVSPVVVHVNSRDQDAELECEGYVGRGYWRPHVEVLEASAHVLLAHPVTREHLARPTQMLADMESAVRAPAAEARAHLAQSWGAACTC